MHRFHSVWRIWGPWLLLALLKDPSVTNPRLEPPDVPANLTDLLYNGDMHTDPKVWVNIAIADFYHKDSVALTH